MGRQAHLTRLALGRSPYEPPLRDENGDLVLGPHTHDDDAKGYVQQFNDKGHPANKVTDAQIRRLRRAQNEVLKVAGVVKSKHDDVGPDHWKEMPNEEREDTMKEENELMRLVRPFDNLILDLVTSWIYAFRSRLVTYESYLRPLLSSMLRSEYRTLGLRETLFSGLPLSMLVAFSRRRRTWLYSFDAFRLSLQNPRTKYHQDGERRLGKCSVHLWELLWFTLEYPYSACASLQILHLIPSTFLLSHRDLVSVFSVLLIDQAPKRPQSFALSDIGNFCVSCVTHPFVMSYILDQIRESLQSGLHAIIRHHVPLPDEPDPLSDKYSLGSAFQHDDELLKASIPGFGWAVDAKRRYYGPKSLSESLRMAFPGFSIGLHAVIRWPPPVRPHITPESEEALKKLCDLRYGVLWRENRQFTEAQRLPDSLVRRRAVEEALSRAGVDPVVDAISIDDWSSRFITDISNDDSTTTPDPQDLFPIAAIDEDVPTSMPPNDEDGGPRASAMELPTSDQGIAELMNTEPISEPVSIPVGTSTELSLPGMPTHFQSTVPLHTLLLPHDPEGQVLPPTPTPGITRALSLNQAPLRPVRRPTDTGVDTSSDIISFSNRPFERAGLPEEAIEEPDDPVQHRVTLLSNYPAEIFVLHASTLLTSMLMLPFDIFYQRTLARTFLSSFRVTNLAARCIVDDVLPSRPWMAFSGMGAGVGCIFAGNLALTFGMQALVSSLVWQGVKRSVLHFGQGFGWGKI